jgi:hypothetical protein
MDIPVGYENLIKVKISQDGQTRLKVSWDVGEQDRPPYFVYRQQLEDAALKCRNLLGELAVRFDKDSNSEYGDILQQVASAGAQMYFLLFDGCAEGGDIAEEVKNYIRQFHSQKTQLIVSADSTCHIPWALVYTEEPPDLDAVCLRPTDGDLPHFWGIQYGVAVLYNSMQLNNLKPALPRKEFKLLFVLAKTVFEKLKGYLNPKERQYLERLVKEPIGEIYSWRDAKKRWEPISNDDSLVYVFCHSDGIRLRLDADELEVVEFRRIFSKRSAGISRLRRPPASLCFLNGCSTANGVKDNSFRVATSSYGFYGFIGTEAPVPAVFAVRFGLSFLHYLFELGWDVQQIIDKLRIAHWPLGLLYSNCAHPRFHVEALEDASKEIFMDSGNYSDHLASDQGVI